MLKHLQLKNIGPAPEVAMDLGSRLNIITGDNGLGKSFLLDVAWWALTRRWPQEVNSQLSSGFPAQPADRKKPAAIRFAVKSRTKDVSYESTYSARDQSWQGKAGRPWNPGLVIYAHAEGSFSVWDPARNYWKQRNNIDIQERLPAYVFSPKEVWDGLEMDVNGVSTVVCNGLIRDWAGWIKEDGIGADNMRIVLEQLSPSENSVDRLEPGPLTRVSLNDVRDIPSLKTSYSDAVPVIHTSSGVRRITALAYMLLWCWQEHQLAAGHLGEEPTRQVVLLIDEIESHLHPKWQRTILSSLLNLTTIMHQQASIQLICATHSPLILASTEPMFNPNTDAWFDLDLSTEDRKPVVELRKRDFMRHGDVSRWLTSEAFDLRQPRSLEAERAITRAVELSAKGSATESEISEVDALLQASLGETDRFWLRWLGFRDRLGKLK
ncbi:MAG: AAA family ATPase [Planctomycetaceae bacterium]|nr:AAA family ATPase [Planctomycetaceae bacterium]